MVSSGDTADERVLLPLVAGMKFVVWRPPGKGSTCVVSMVNGKSSVSLTIICWFILLGEGSPDVVYPVDTGAV